MEHHLTTRISEDGYQKRQDYIDGPDLWQKRTALPNRGPYW